MPQSLYPKPFKRLAEVPVLGTPIAALKLGGMENFTYFVWNWDQGLVSIIDPHKELDFSEYLGRFEALSSHFKVSRVLLTHTHHDHIGGVEQVLLRSEKPTLCLHPLEVFRIENKSWYPSLEGSRLQLIATDDSVIESNPTFTLTALHTPGHSQGGVCFHYTPLLENNPSLLFTGDTVFVGDVGRTDLETGSNESMYNSIQKLKKLPHSTIFLPGHDYGRTPTTSLEREVETNPGFLVRSVQELAELP